MASQLFAKKSLQVLLDEMAGEHRLRRVLGPVTLTALGIGAVIGAGIFVATGEAAQTNTLRWEDYSQTAVDPSDDCTIWYVGDYFRAAATSYSTRIAALRLPGCP